MDVLNTVVNILHLLAEVVISVLQVTWMISKDVFRDKPKAKHYSRNKKQRPPSSFPKPSGRYFHRLPDKELTTSQTAPFLFVV